MDPPKELNGDEEREGVIAHAKLLETKSQRPRVLRYDEVYDIRTSQTKLIKTKKPTAKSYTKRRPVLVVRRLIDYKGRHMGTEVDIESKLVSDVLLEINKGIDGLTLYKSPPMADPRFFYHNYQNLRERLELEKNSNAVDENLVADLAETIKFIEEEHGAVLKNMRTLIPANEVTWELLWTLFPPDALVYRFHEPTEQDQVLQFRSMKVVKRQTGELDLVFSLEIIADDGFRFGLSREPVGVEILEYVGTRRIQDLAVYPLSHHVDEVGIRTKCLERGRIYASITKPVATEMSGPALSEKILSDGRHVVQKFTTRGRCMIDAAAFRSFDPNMEFFPNVTRIIARDEMTDTQHILCSPVAFGFNFGTKKWGGFSMSQLVDIEWNLEAFDGLVMKTTTKTFLHSLVKHHTVANEDYDDIISGKGKGLIALLTGPPGSGKTLTAEAIAEVTRRPLYAVSAGELGITPKEVDEHLTMTLELAHKWDAVLLLDEADVFLQKRDGMDIARNALVGVFLRQLEYFQGILILTTNRVAHVDPAFQSRIHVTLQYQPLDTDAREKVWHTFLEKARGKNLILEVTVSDEQVKELAVRPLNGRHIKNVVSAARAVAMEAREPMGIMHLEPVLEMVSLDDKYQ